MPTNAEFVVLAIAIAQWCTCGLGIIIILRRLRYLSILSYNVLNMKTNKAFTLCFVAHVQLSLILLVSVAFFNGSISFLYFLGSTVADNTTLEYFLIVSLCMRGLLPFVFNNVFVNVQLVVLNYMCKTEDNTRANIDDVAQKVAHQKSYKYTYISVTGVILHGIAILLIWIFSILYTGWAFVEPIKYILSRDYRVLNRLGIMSAVPAWFTTDSEDAKFVKNVSSGQCIIFVANEY